MREVGFPRRAKVSNFSREKSEMRINIARLLWVCETVYDGHFDQLKNEAQRANHSDRSGDGEILSALRSAAVDPKALVFATREGLPLGRWNLLRKGLKPATKKSGLSVSRGIF
jgi:hypothetical protein